MDISLGRGFFRAGLLASVAGLSSVCMTSAPALAAGVDFVFVVDESGSMSGEQDFIPTLVNDLQTAFSASGFTDNRFALVGFGDYAEVPRLVAGFGTAADIAAASTTLTTSGGTEDGYAGIDFALQNLAIRSDLGQFLLITDEDRDDITAGGLTFNSILGELVTTNTGLNGILDINSSADAVTAGGGEPLVVDLQNNRIYVADTTSPTGYRIVQLASGVAPIDGGYGTTVADYVDLANQTVGGCVGSISQFRTNDPATVNAFANALVDCLTLVVVNNPGSFQARTAVVLKNFFGSAQYSTLVASYPGHLALSDRNPYARRQASLGGVYALTGDGRPGAASGATGEYVSPDGKFSFYGAFGLDWGTIDSTATAMGSDIEGRSVSLGGDYALAPNVFLGAGATIATVTNSLDNDTDSQDTSAYNLYLAAAYATAQYYLDAVVQAGYLNQDTTREAGGNTLTGNTTGFSWGAEISGAYDFELAKGMTIGPVASLRYASVSLKSYQESGGPFAASIGDQSYDSLVSSLGAQFALETAVSATEDLRVTLRGAWEHDFLDGADAVSVAQITTGNSFIVTPDTNDENWFAVGAGIRLQSADYAVFGDFDTRLGYDVGDLYYGRVGFKLFF
ncbi:autotransporter domain-containing protein [Zavarzinia sp.]|uniref:autotransporter domain-containing protein n=1 Tax=Zavarzinia sp. TaxID=2027920 RepID=UPI0035680F74